jgi:hypothetical protein
VGVSVISISGTDSGNYALANATATTTANISASATVTLLDNHISGDSLSASYTSAAFNNKNVATGKTVTVSSISTSGTDSGNGGTVTDSYTGATFADKNVGTGKAVSVSGISISGTDSGNYTFNTTASAAVDITARPLTVSAVGANKVYDGTAQEADHHGRATGAQDRRVHRQPASRSMASIDCPVSAVRCPKARSRWIG